MKKKILLSQSGFHSLIKNKIIKEQSDLDEYGRKGQWKSEWNEEDQMLAMYNSLYGVEDLGFNKKEVAENIIGTSVESFNQQTSNFDFLSGKNGLSRPHSVQSPVYEKFKDVPKVEFKSICLEIIHKRLENPEESVVKKKLGNEIGSKRDEISQSRKDALTKAGFDPDKKKLTMIGSRLKNPPVEDEPIEDLPSLEKTAKDEIRDFLKSIHDRVKNVKSQTEAEALADDIQFIMDYIDSELKDKKSEDIAAEAANIMRNKNLIFESGSSKIIKRITEINKKLN